MKSRKEVEELRKMSDSELQKELDATHEALYKLRFQSVVDEMVDTSVVRKAKKRMARIKTILRSRELESN